MERMRREAARREQELQAETQAAREELEIAVAGISDALVILDDEWRFTFLNDRAAEIVGGPKDEALGRTLWELFPGAVDSGFQTELRRAMTERSVRRFEYFFSTWNRWFEIRAYPWPRGLSLFASDITERRKAEEERRTLFEREAEARAEAESSNRAKDEFLATLGHELRNPLGAITNAVAVLEEDSKDDRSARLHAIIGRQSRVMLRLIEDLLDVARISAGKVVLKRRLVDLRETVERCLAALGQRYVGVMSRYRIEVHAESVIVEGDPARLEQILTNLLENALKYTPRGGQIRIEARCEDERAVLGVRDSGMGIAPELLPHIFDLFVQAEGALDRAQGGLGIGLTLVRRLAELHGGAVRVSSEGPGLGSEFVVEIPTARSHMTSQASPSPKMSPTGRRILVVDDNEDARWTLRVLLEGRGHRVEEAGNGEQALRRILSERPEVAFIDIGLPVMDGYDVARQVRNMIGRQVFLVALTGYGQSEDRERALEAGFDEYMVKPADPAQLEQMVKMARRAS
jgi:PAS domain S-box-containing protein